MNLLAIFLSEMVRPTKTVFFPILPRIPRWLDDIGKFALAVGIAALAFLVFGWPRGSSALFALGIGILIEGVGVVRALLEGKGPPRPKGPEPWKFYDKISDTIVYALVLVLAALGVNGVLGAFAFLVVAGVYAIAVTIQGLSKAAAGV